MQLPVPGAARGQEPALGQHRADRPRVVKPALGESPRAAAAVVVVETVAVVAVETPAEAGATVPVLAAVTSRAQVAGPAQPPQVQHLPAPRPVRAHRPEEPAVPVVAAGRARAAADQRWPTQ